MTSIDLKPDQNLPEQSWIDQQSSHKTPVNLSIIIPAYNERWRLPSTLIDIIDYFDKRPQSFEVLVVDDGSTDETSQVVRKFERVREQIRLICLPHNEGKGYAVKTGALNAAGEKIIFLDADGATPIIEIERLISAIESGADIAIGSRAKKSPDTSISTIWYRKFLGRIFNTIVNILILPGIEDTQCGFKMFTSISANKILEFKDPKVSVLMLRFYS